MENQTEIEVSHPDYNYNFPVTVINGCKRKCNFKWFIDRNWLTYDIFKDCVYCHVCKEGLRKKILITKNYKTSFMEEGVNDWKNAHDKFVSHEKSSIHIEAVSKLLENGNKNENIVKLFGQENLKEKQESFRSLLKIFHVLKVLTRQGEAIRGHTYEESNFVQHLKCVAEILKAEGNEALTAWMNKKTFRFISPTIQNEIVQWMALDILETVTENVKKANFFSILLDESRDVSNNEQAAFSVRFVDSNFNRHEVFLGKQFKFFYFLLCPFFEDTSRLCTCVIS